MPGGKKRQRASYDAEFKLDVVKRAKVSNNTQAAEHFGVNEKQVRNWRKQEEQLSKMAKKKKANRGPKQGKYEELGECAVRLD